MTTKDNDNNLTPSPQEDAQTQEEIERALEAARLEAVRLEEARLEAVRKRNNKRLAIGAAIAVALVAFLCFFGMFLRYVDPEPTIVEVTVQVTATEMAAIATQDVEPTATDTATALPTLTATTVPPTATPRPTSTSRPTSTPRPTADPLLANVSEFADVAVAFAQSQAGFFETAGLIMNDGTITEQEATILVEYALDLGSQKDAVVAAGGLELPADFEEVRDTFLATVIICLDSDISTLQLVDDIMRRPQIITQSRFDETTELIQACGASMDLSTAAVERYMD